MDKLEKEWNDFVKKYPINSEIEGAIIHKAPFGVFIDFGKPFLALLQVVQIEESDYQAYTEDKIFAIGEKIKGKILDHTMTSGIGQVRITLLEK